MCTEWTGSVPPLKQMYGSMLVVLSYMGLVQIQGEITTMSRTFAYCRVSTADQTKDNLVQEIAAAGFAVTKARTIVETV